MKALLLAVLTALSTLGLGAREAAQDPAGPRFVVRDVFVDAGDRALGAWQFEFTAPAGARIVGVEGGEHAAFASAPYYDPAALRGGRVVVAAFSLRADLPRGRTRVARLHLQLDAGVAAEFTVELQACADARGAAFDAEITERGR